MAVVVEMDGLPANVESNAVVLAVRKILQKLKIRYWVHDFTYSEDTHTKKCKIEFYNKTEAPKAIERLTSKPQTIIGVQCELTITVLSEKSGKDNPPNHRDRSRSPLSKEEVKINKEIEHLKKTKEELEKRKTELIRKKMNFDKEVKPGWNNTGEHATLPKNTLAENIILEQMKPLLKPYTLKRYYQFVLKTVHVEVRKRLAILIEENKKLQSKGTITSEMVKAYRYTYLQENDATMISKVVEEIKQAFWSFRPKNAEGFKMDVFEFDESSDEENNTPVQKQANKESKKSDGNVHCNKEQTTTQMDTEEKTAESEEPKIPNTVVPKKPEVKEPEISEVKEPKVVETEKQKIPEAKEPEISMVEEPEKSKVEEPKIPESEEPDTDKPKMPEVEDSEISEVEPKISEIGHPKIPEVEPNISDNREPGDILFEGGSDWNDEGDKEMEIAS